MDIDYKGANCIVINTKGSKLIIDPKAESVKLAAIDVKNATVVATQDALADKAAHVLLDGPGEYEANDASVKGMAVKRLIDHGDELAATVYRIQLGGVTFAVVGHVVTPLSEEVLESLGVVDVAIIPVGGGGYTLDAHQAVATVRQLDPKVVIPTHYADGLSYEIEQAPLDAFVKELSAPLETIDRWKIKNGALPDGLTVIEIKRS